MRLRAPVAAVPVASALIALQVGAAPPVPPALTCRVDGTLAQAAWLSRRGACRAVVEGIPDEDRRGRVDILLRFPRPGTATANLVVDGVPRPPISVAAGDREMRRRDLVELGWTIAQLLRGY